MEKQIRKMEQEIETLKHQIRQLQTGSPAGSDEPRFVQPELHASTGENALHDMGRMELEQFDTFENFASGE
ncbi:hypothetical protein [Effusibacillus pohliae]|uniref:hypothetical protein n=1 Tax=Effusibacillus pohliae TaxID=232270 RepID=UPI000366F9BE|nr:hypothetical protein [Effusibacillus pohliae]